MTASTGVVRILRFNWPWYAGALAATAVGIVAVAWWLPAGPWRIAAIAALTIGDGWLLLSLAVSHIVYDRSALRRGGWLDGIAASTVAILHAGHDEASEQVARRLPGAVRHVFDVCDPTGDISPSLRRARAEAAYPVSVVAADRIPLDDHAVDLAVVAFSAHELRNPGRRTAFFRELARIVGPQGRILVVEHLRDGWNLLAYGPGFLHFLPRRVWERTFSEAGLRVARDSTFTPWVHAFELRTTP